MDVSRLRGWAGRRLTLGSRRGFALALTTSLVGLAVAATILTWPLWHPEAAADAEVVVPPGKGGALVIAGGGKLSENVRRQFFDLAGGRSARIVVIPTGLEADSPERARLSLDHWAAMRPASLRLLHARSRAVAESDAFLKPLSEATGVWLGGGNQGWFAATYGGTEVERRIKALLERGGVVGGTSAGAAIMSGIAIMGGREEASLGQGFDLFPGVVIDQHFLKRNRLARLIGVINQHADLIGLGIDESTALVVRLRHGQLGVVGESYVVACVPQASGSPPRIEVLKPGDQIALEQLREPGLRAVSKVSIDDLLSTSALK